MDRIVIRKSISLKILLPIVLSIGLILLGGFVVIYVKDFYDRAGEFEKTVEAGNWEQAETELAVIKEQKFFDREILQLELDYLRAKTLEGAYVVDLMRMLHLAKYLYHNYDRNHDELKEVMSDAYYALGSPYYTQVYDYLGKAYEKHVAKGTPDEELIPFYKKLYVVTAYLGYTDESTFFLKKIIPLEKENYSFHIKLVLGYLKHKEYEKVTETLEDVLFNNEKDVLSLQKSAMMLYALANYLDFPVKADFYLEYTLAKSHLFQKSRKDIREDFNVLRHIYDDMDHVFTEIEQMTLEERLYIST